MIYLNTLQHTGTWFLISFLLEHPEVEGFSQVSTLPMHLAGLDVPEHKLLGGKRVRERLPSHHMGQYVVHQHPILQPGRPALVPEQERLCRELLKVVPMRDPLMAVMTALTRADGVREFMLPRIVDRWVAYCRVVRDLDVVYLPLDLPSKMPTDRLANVLQKLGLDPWVEGPRSVVNSSGGGWKRRYAVGDRDFFCYLPEFRQLQAYEDELRPWLEGIGYRDLLWWT